MAMTSAERQRLYRERRKTRDRETLAVLRDLAAEAGSEAERDGGSALRKVVADLLPFPRALYWRGRRDGLREALEVMAGGIGSDWERAERLARRCGLSLSRVRGTDPKVLRVLWRSARPGDSGG